MIIRVRIKESVPKLKGKLLVLVCLGGVERHAKRKGTVLEFVSI